MDWAQGVPTLSAINHYLETGCITRNPTIRPSLGNTLACCVMACEHSTVQSCMSLDQRQVAAKKYRPNKINLLLVAEAPPCTPDRYFYFERVDKHDWLFRYVWEGLMGDKPDRTQKAKHLAALRDAGVYMIDLHEETISQPSLADLRPHVPGLLDRARALKPRHIAFIKFNVYDAAFKSLHAAGLPVIDERIPFPASGQQKKFLESFRRAAAVAGFACQGAG